MAVHRRYGRKDFAEGALPRFGPGAAAITAPAKLMRRDPSAPARGAARPRPAGSNPHLRAAGTQIVCRDARCR